MAAVFPESMDRLDYSRPEESFSTIENYIRYMGERMDFALRGVTRNVSAAGISSAEMYLLLVELQNTAAALSSTVSEMAGQITAMTGQIAGLDERIAALEGTA